jgi:hypothetical protein
MKLRIHAAAALAVLRQPPAEKSTARQDQAGESSTDDGAGHVTVRLHFDSDSVR